MISNLCDPDRPTLQTDRRTDRRTDDMQFQYRAIHYSASRGNKMQGWTSQDWTNLPANYTPFSSRVLISTRILLRAHSSNGISVGLHNTQHCRFTLGSIITH